MQTQVLDGTSLADEIKMGLGEKVVALKKEGVHPSLTAIICGSNPASEVYLRHKAKACQKVGIQWDIIRLFDECVESWCSRYQCSYELAQKKLIEEIKMLNANPMVHGILVQLPVKPLDEFQVFDAICPEKDVDCFSPTSVGMLLQGRGEFMPCTPQGITRLLWVNRIEMHGKSVCIINNSNIVGKPLAAMLMQNFYGSTVTVCHKATPTKTLVEATKNADIVVVAVGIPGFLKPEMVRRGAVVVDVGISRVEDKVVGDVDNGMWGHAGWLTPVPGGVGPMTVAALLENTVQAASKHSRR